MLSLKANAALMRLKEIEEKYKMKHKQQNREEDSSISSVTIDLSENFSAILEKSPRNVSKLKLDVKMPDTRFDNEKATSNKMSTRPFGDTNDLKVDLDVVIPLKDKLQEDKKQESLSSDITTIQENSSINSVSIGSTNSSLKSFLQSKSLRQDTANNKVFGHKSGMKVTAKIGRERTSDKSSEISGGRTSRDNSSTTKRSRVPKKSNDVSKSCSDLKSKEPPFKMEAIVKKPEANFDQKSWHSNYVESLSDNSIVEESIDTIVDGSEIISELSRVDENVAVKVEDSTNVSRNSEHLEAKDISVTIVESSKHLVAENGYANDTFEDISSSTTLSKSKLQDEEVTEEKNYDFKDEKIIDLVAPKSSTIEMYLESASYVSDLERTGTNPDNIATHLIKSSDSTDSRLEKQRKQSQQQTEFEKDISSVININKNVSSISKLSISKVAEMDTEVLSRRKNSSKMTSASRIDQQENGQESRGKTSDETGERTMMDVSDSSKEFEKENENVLNERSEKQISQDAEDDLRKLHRDMVEALTKRRASSKTARKASENSLGSKVKLEIRDDTITTRKITAKTNSERRRPSMKNQELECNSDREHSNTRKARAKVTNSKSVKARGSTGSRKKDKALNFDGKQMRVLRKRIMELRLRQEREDLQKYLRELKDLRLESFSTRSYFSPLEFPKIAEFTFDATDSESKPDDRAVFRERVSAIRRWLKDQYILYRDYCTMAQAINAHYVPTTLEDTKKIIHGSRKTVKSG